MLKLSFAQPGSVAAHAAERARSRASVACDTASKQAWVPGKRSGSPSAREIAA